MGWEVVRGNDKPHITEATCFLIQKIFISNSKVGIRTQMPGSLPSFLSTIWLSSALLKKWFKTHGQVSWWRYLSLYCLTVVKRFKRIKRSFFSSCLPKGEPNLRALGPAPGSSPIAPQHHTPPLLQGGALWALCYRDYLGFFLKGWPQEKLS